MKEGDLVVLSNQGLPVRVIPDGHPSPLKNTNEFPPGTLALILETGDIGIDGPSMDSYARVMVGGSLIGFVWLSECQELNEQG